MAGSLFLAVALALTNDQVVVAFSEKGCVGSVVERATGRELASRNAIPFVTLGTKSCWQIAPTGLTAYDDGRKLSFSFPQPLGRVVLAVTPFEGGWTFAVAELPTNGTLVAHLGCLAFDPALAMYLGDRANAASDERSAVSIRSYDLRSRMLIDKTHLWTQIAPSAAVGSRFGFAAGPRTGFLEQMKAMTLASGAPHTTAGGAWALEGGIAGASYLKAIATEESIDRWLELAERGGFGVVHFRESWYARRGHYDPNPKDWPRGLDGMRDAVSRLHSRGVLAGLHTLTGCIDFRDPWVAGPENADLLAWRTYTLAEPLSATADELVVCERPDGNHSTVMTGSTRGNAIRIGSEIVQYAAVVREKPYRFTGLVRGAFGTKVAAHAKGDEAAYLQQMYGAFYPKPGSPLAEKLVSAISNVYNTCGFDQIYCDGCEGMVGHYGMSWMRNRLIGACAAGGRPVINEDSVGGLDQSWWFHSRVGAWDDTFFAPKRFVDRHFEWVKNAPLRKADFLEPHMGWWSVACSPDYMRAHMVDDMEYFAMRTTGLDASMSVDWLPANKGPVSFHLSRQMTVLGWYEHARRAKAFAPETTALFCRKGVETRLRQNAAGDWTVTPVVEKIHKFPSSAGNVWRTRLASDRVSLRLHALYSGLPYDDPDALTWLSAADIPSLKCSAAKDVTFALATERDPEKGEVISIRAANAGRTSRGAWAVADQIFAPPRDIKGCRVIRVKVRGDGSGAVLNFQLDKPRHHGRAYSDHYVKVDFTGWKEFELPVRERDAEDYDKYLWPYSDDYHNVYHAWLNFGAIGSFNLLVNEIPAGGSVDIRLADVRLTSQVKYVRRRQALVVNGQTHEIPFAMETGTFAEYADGVWTHYAANGEPIARQTADRRIAFLKGENEIVYRGGEGRGDLTPRSELDLFVAASSRAAFRTRPEQGWGSCMAYEAVEPMMYDPSRGFAELPAIRTRPGETAVAEAWVYGPVRPCSVRIGAQSADVPALASGERRLVSFPKPFSGALPVTIRTDDPSAHIRIEFAKRYGTRRDDACIDRADVRIFRGDARHAYRDPAALWHNGCFFLFFTLVETEDDGSVFSYLAESESRDLVHWSPPRKLTPRDNAKDYSSPGNVVRDGDEWVLCLQTYPRPGNRSDGKVRYANENARLFTMRSRDLRQWSAPELLKVKGPDVPEAGMGRMIDPYLLKLPEGGWMCFYKQNGVSFSRSTDLKVWMPIGRAEAGENVCVVREKDCYWMVHSPENGIGLKTSTDLLHWQDLPGRITLGQRNWPWARGRLTAGFLLDARSVKGVGKWLLFFHGSGPRKENEGDFDRNASLAVVCADTVEELLKEGMWSAPH